MHFLSRSRNTHVRIASSTRAEGEGDLFLVTFRGEKKKFQRENEQQEKRRKAVAPSDEQKLSLGRAHADASLLLRPFHFLSGHKNRRVEHACSIMHASKAGFRQAREPRAIGSFIFYWLAAIVFARCHQQQKKHTLVGRIARTQEAAFLPTTVHRALLVLCTTRASGE